MIGGAGGRRSGATSETMTMWTWWPELEASVHGDEVGGAAGSGKPRPQGGQIRWPPTSRQPDSAARMWRGGGGGGCVAWTGLQAEEEVRARGDSPPSPPAIAAPDGDAHDAR